MLHALYQIFDKSPAGDRQAVLILHHQSKRSDNRRHDHSGQPVAGHTGNGPNANHPRLYSFDLICQAADCPLCLRDLWHFQRTSCQLRPDAFRHRGKKRRRLCFRQLCHGNGSVNDRRCAASVRCCGAEKGNSFVLGLEAVMSTSGLLGPVPACLMAISFPHKLKEPPDCHFNRMALYQSI